MKNLFRRPDPPEPAHKVEPAYKVIEKEYGGDDACPHLFIRQFEDYISYHGDETPMLHGISATEGLACKRVWAAAVVYDE